MGTDETAQEEAGEQETNDEEPTVEQMLENLDELKEKRSRSLRPYDVVDQLPPMAKYEDGELKVAVNRQWEKVISLTPLRRKILSCLEKGMEQQEIVNRDIASQGYVAKTKNDFGFLLDNPALYDAFVERALRTEDDYIIRGETGEDEIELSKKNKSKATKTAERLISNGWDNVVIEEPDGNVLSYSKNRLSSPQSPDSSDQQEGKATNEQEEQTRPLLEDEYTDIVAALHRDDKGEEGNQNCVGWPMSEYTEGDWVGYRNDRGYVEEKKILEVRPDEKLVVGSHEYASKVAVIKPARVIGKIE